MKRFFIYSNAFTLIELLVVIAIINMLVAILLPAVLSVRETMRRGHCQNNLSKIVLATKMYEESFGILPSGPINETNPIRNVPIGNHIGWLPRILPFLEQTPLYNTIDFSKDVYDPANEPAWLSVTPEIFRCTSDGSGSGGRHSNYMACHEGLEMPIDTGNRGVFFLNSQLRSKDILDGNSHTVWFGEAIVIPTTLWRTQIPFSGSFCTSLGWMSGTPGTIRNTGHKINAQPFYVTWAMPFKEAGQINPAGFPYKLSTDAKNENDTETDSVLPATLWATELPEQFQVGGFNSFHPGGANHAFGDGKVRMIFETIDSDLYKKLGQRDDGATVSLDD
jgi:prepilin-type N-terminal cleavage/methylation domain-containing protein